MTLFDELDDVPVGELRVTVDYGKGKPHTFRTRPSDSCNKVADMVGLFISEEIRIRANKSKNTPGWKRFMKAYNKI